MADRSSTLQRQRLSERLVCKLRRSRLKMSSGISETPTPAEEPKGEIVEKKYSKEKNPHTSPV
jgi:hypothetical protein